MDLKISGDGELIYDRLHKKWIPFKPVEEDNPSCNNISNNILIETSHRPINTTSSYVTSISGIHALTSHQPINTTSSYVSSIFEIITFSSLHDPFFASETTNIGQSFSMFSSNNIAEVRHRIMPDNAKTIVPYKGNNSSNSIAELQLQTLLHNAEAPPEEVTTIASYRRHNKSISTGFDHNQAQNRMSATPTLNASIVHQLVSLLHLNNYSQYIFMFPNGAIVSAFRDTTMNIDNSCNEAIA